MKNFSILILLISIFSLSSCLKNISTQSKEFEDKIKKLTLELKSKYNTKNKKIKRLAVMPYINEGGQRSHLGVFVSNSIQEHIFDTSMFDLLERERIDSILDEYKFNQTGLVKNISRKRLGKLLGADIVLLGTIFKEKDSFKIRSRIVNLETGSVLSIASTSIKAYPVFVSKYKDIIKPKIFSINGAYEFIVKEISVRERKSDGRYWDVEPTNPDIYYILRKNNKQIFPTYALNGKTAKDVLKSSFEDVKVKIVIEEDDVFEIVIRDADHLADDFIGSIILPPTKLIKIINNEKNDFKFDQVKNLSIKMRKIQ